jgi:cyclic pyranopterin phosphate synthase
VSGARSTHVDEAGRARMVDVGAKPVTQREAVARGRIRLSPDAYRAAVEGSVRKGDVLGVARIAGIQAAKRTADWIPLAHPLPLEVVEIEFRSIEDVPAIEIEARVCVSAKTGVEMEAMLAVSAAALTIYDMCKAIDRAMVIEGIRLVRKSGGKSGLYQVDDG